MRLVWLRAAVTDRQHADRFGGRRVARGLPRYLQPHSRHHIAFSGFHGLGE